ncbi:pilus assembly PilX N-terminal domain-containing protein [Metasolibacillus meyeri]|uniref:pilus assembly PilX N-terminal domain-containing protein n=1 Tax=Metasolibacillus meyeri TaxID=1071052 RepID=UPI000D303B86|nr:pilus assembly PilX N-terminal domain-containing protein [Metasolibacillus meyeri]
MKCKYNTNNEKGYTLIIVVLVIALISILGLGLMTLTANTLNTTKHERDDQSLFYIAEAGINIEKSNIEQIVYESYVNTMRLHEDMSVEDRSEFNFEEYYKGEVFKYLSLNAPYAYSNFEKQFNKQPEACISLISFEEPNKINIESMGYLIDSDNNNTVNCSDKENIPSQYRVVQHTVSFNTDLKFLIDLENQNDNGIEIEGLPQLTVLTKGDITLSGSSNIHGSVATSGIVKLSGVSQIKNNIGASAERIDVPIGTGDNYYNTINNRLVSVDLPELPALPPFPSNVFNTLESANAPNGFPMTGNNYEAGWNPPRNRTSLVLTENAKVQNFIVPGGFPTIDINIGSNTVNLLIENLSLGQSTNLNIIGSGTLNIYVKNSLNLGGAISNQSNHAGKVNIYYAGTTEPQFSGSQQTVHGSLYVEKSNLTLDGSKTIAGHIMSGGNRISLLGGGPPSGHYILAPNADVIANNNYTGVILAKTFTGTGNAQINYGVGNIRPPFETPPNYDLPNRDGLINGEDFKEVDKN